MFFREDRSEASGGSPKPPAMYSDRLRVLHHSLAASDIYRGCQAKALAQLNFHGTTFRCPAVGKGNE